MHKQQIYITAIGLITATLILAIGIIAILALLFQGVNFAEAMKLLSPMRIAYVIYIASLQASLSTLFCLIIAIVATHVMVRRFHWFAQASLRNVIALAMVVPTTVAATGILSVWGRQGWFADLFRWINQFIFSQTPEWFTIYGLHGVILAHVFFNVPLMIRIFLPLIGSIAETQRKLANQFGLNRWQTFKTLEWPAIRRAIPGISALVFLLCFTSFSLVLMLGGGPGVTTLEVEIYSAVRFSFNLSGAALLSLVQIGFAGLMITLINLFDSGLIHRTWPRAYNLRPIGNDQHRLLDIIVLTIIIVLIVLPLAAIVISGLNHKLLTVLNEPVFWSALSNSLLIAIGSSLIVVTLSLLIASARVNLVLPNRFGGHQYSKILLLLLNTGIMLYLVVPSIVLGTAAFIILRSSGDIYSLAWMVVLFANVLLCLPFIIRIIENRLAGLAKRHDRLAQALGIFGIKRLKTLTLPAIKHELGLALGLAAALSLGDLGVIALFASADFQTLPWLLYQTSGRYASDEAASLALILLLITAIIFKLGFGLANLIPIPRFHTSDINSRS